ncbi:MAG: sulfotransferase domain-containing protein [Anaerolineales bacterium]
MLILNIGMPRSGTLWRYKIVRDLVIAGGGIDGVEIRKKFFLNPFIGLPNADLNTAKPKRLIPAAVPSFLGYTYVLNTHTGPTNLAVSMLKNGRMKAVYGFRDPRDCILSILEYSQRSLPQYSAHFLQVKNVKQAVSFMDIYIQAWKKWTQLEETFIVQYEEMLNDYQSVIDRLIQYLELEISPEQRDTIASTYLPRQKPKEDVRIHFSEGRANRFREKFTQEEQDYLLDRYQAVLEQMGYAA